MIANWLPRSGAGRAFLLGSSIVALVRLLGEQQSAVGGATIPDVPGIWLLVMALGAFVLLPREGPGLRLGRSLAVALAVVVSGWVLWRDRAEALRPPGVPATVYHLENGEWAPREEVRLPSLRIENRRDLARITGRRRDVKLSVDGVLHAPEGGLYGIALDCDDRCTLSIDGEAILDTATAREAEVRLASGRHRLVFEHVQREGPARSVLRWRRPVWLEFLPIEHYLGDARYSPELAPSALSFALSLLWSLVAFALVARAGESRAAWRAELAPVVVKLARRSLAIASWARRGSSRAVLGVFFVGAVLASLAMVRGSVRVSAVRGDWTAVATGVQPFGDGDALGGGARAVVHFHELDGRPGALELDLRAADKGPVTVDVSRDGERFESATIEATPSTLRVPFAQGSGSIDVGIEVVSRPLSAGALYRIDAIRLVRAPSSLHYALALGLFLGSMGIAVVSARQGSLAGAAVDGLLTSLLGAAFLIYCLDPSRSSSFDETTRWGFRIVLLAVLWARTAFASPSTFRAVAAVVATVGLLYLPALRHGFVTDDFLFGRAMTWGQALSTLVGHWDPFGLANDHYRPVVALSLALDYVLWGSGPQGYHATNLLVHVLNGLLAFLLLRRLDVPPGAALLGALAWCAHPMGATAASWANQRTDGIMAMFYLSCLSFLLAPRFTRWHLAGVVATGGLALGSKEMAATLPLTGFLVLWLRPHLTTRQTRYGSVAALAGLVATYVAYWVYLFPTKATGATGLALGLPSAIDWVRHPLLLLYPSVFLPGDYGLSQSLLFGRVPLGYLAAGPAVWVAAFLVVRRCGSPAATKLALFGGLWPVATVPPLLGLSGGVDLFRVGWLTALGFGVTWAALLSRNDTARVLRGTAVIALAVWFGTASIASSRAWGPGGFMKHLGTQWTLHSIAWRSSLSPEMRDLYDAQVERENHAIEWVTGGR